MTTSVLGSIIFGVQQLGARLVIIMGHSRYLPAPTNAWDGMYPFTVIAASSVNMPAAAVMDPEQLLLFLLGYILVTWIPASAALAGTAWQLARWPADQPAFRGGWKGLIGATVHVLISDMDAGAAGVQQWRMRCRHGRTIACIPSLQMRLWQKPSQMR